MVDQPLPLTSGVLREHCTHRWLIDYPDGETSRGTCKYCGTSRNFRNYEVRSQNPFTSRNRQAKPNV